MFSQVPLSEHQLLDQLHQYSENHFWFELNQTEKYLFQELNRYKENLNFPAVKNDVGQILNFIVRSYRPKRIFEFGSGYGHSCFWYLAAIHEKDQPQQIFLTEKRTDLGLHFHQLPWPQEWKEKIHYEQGDAFIALENKNELDLILVDGQKSSYLEFIIKALPQLKSQGLIVIDNAFIKGGFLLEENQDKLVVKNTKALYEFIETSSLNRVFLPVRDGLILLQKN